ncbi:hypothetical protein GCM10023324_01980 [Streptomyces youssoufiensis]
MHQVPLATVVHMCVGAAVANSCRPSWPQTASARAAHDKPAGDNQVVGLSAADGKDIWSSPRSGLRLFTNAAVTVCAGRAGVVHGWIAANAETPLPPDSVPSGCGQPRALAEAVPSWGDGPIGS